MLGQSSFASSGQVTIDSEVEIIKESFSVRGAPISESSTHLKDTDDDIDALQCKFSSKTETLKSSVSDDIIHISLDEPEAESETPEQPLKDYSNLRQQRHDIVTVFSNEIDEFEKSLDKS